MAIFFVNYSHGCAIDVAIAEGDTLEFCEGANVSLNASTGYISYQWTGPENLTGQVVFPQFSGQYVVSAEDGIGCISTDTIEVIINANPSPSISSSEGNPICPNPGGTLLSLSSAYASYDWGGGNVGSTYFASGAGNYSVIVVDENGCTGSSSITIDEIKFDLTVTMLGGCQGATALLEATGGGTYVWSNGETGSSIVVSPTSTTTFSVDITNGTCSESLSATVSAIVPTEYDLVDTLYMGVGDQEVLTGPMDGFTNYNWYPEGQIDNPVGATVTVTAASSHTLYLEATHYSGCIYEDSVAIIVVDLTVPNGFSPNSDGINDLFIIPQLYELDGSIVIWNRWGDVVFEREHYENDWDGTCRAQLCAGNGIVPDGTYFCLIKVDEIEYKSYITLSR